MPPRAPAAAADEDASAQRIRRFVIQQHHARSLHWDLRLERAGVLVSWAVPRGLPRDQRRNHLAVHTEDHPMEYLDFAGDIPAGEYGGGTMMIFDRGTYRTEKWRDDEVMVVLSGERVTGRYVLFRTAGKDWMVRRMDPAPPGWTSMPERVRPMQATRAARLPADDDAWAYEMRWDGVRALAYVSGGRLRLTSADDEDLTGAYPQLRDLAERMAPVEAVLDGELVAFDAAGRVRRADARAARVQYLIADVLWLEGVATVDVPYAERRDLLDGLGLAGPHWQTPPYFPGGGRFALDAGREQGLTGVLAKRLDSRYAQGRRSRDWLSVDA